MMKNQYKDQLGSIALSEQFKQDLKTKMAEEFSKQATTIIHKETTPSKFNFNLTKYSRYIACAACVAMILATVGITSAINGGFKSMKTFDAAEGEDSNMYGLNEADIIMDDSVAEEAADLGAPAVEEPVESGDNEIEAESEEAEVEADVAADIEDAVESAETEDAVVEYEEPMTNNALTKSAYAPENYDGEYFAEDYVYITGGSGELEALSIWEAEDKDISYNSLCDDILSELDEVGLIKFDIIERISSDSADSITGDSEFSVENTLYKAELTYDYLTNDSADGEIYISSVGNELVQEQGFPVFEVGDTILALVDPGENYSRMIEQAVYKVHRVGGIDIGYHLVYGNMDPGYTDMGILDMERSIVTSTSNNPAEYTNKVAVKELTRYLRRNLKKREITFADMTSAKEITGELIDIEGDPVYEGSLAISESKVSITCDGEKISLGNTGKDMVLTTMKGENQVFDDHGVVVFGGNVMHFDAKLPYSGHLYMIEIVDGNAEHPIMVNGVTAGDSIDALIGAFDIDIPAIENGVCDIDVLKGGDAVYRITVTVENSVVTSILVNSRI